MRLKEADYLTLYISKAKRSEGGSLITPSYPLVIALRFDMLGNTVLTILLIVINEPEA